MIPKRDFRYQAAILQAEQVLLIRAMELDGTTFWLPPGGGRDPGETEEACVAREVLEETGLTVTVERLLFATPALADDPIYTGLKTYLCHIQSGTATPGTEPEVDVDGHQTIQEVGWFDLHHPSTWPPEAMMGKITTDWLIGLQSTLGLTTDANDPTNTP